MTLRAGKELDRVIARDVLGHGLAQQKNGTWMEATPKGPRPLAAYSKDMAAAWEVVERYAITLLPIHDGENAGWFAMVGKGQRWRQPAEFVACLQEADFLQSGAAVSDSAALAICIAATKAYEKRQALGATGTMVEKPSENSLQQGSGLLPH